MINEWVKNATDNRIDSIISPTDSTAVTDLILANAVYFKGEWQERFGYRIPDKFHRLDGLPVVPQFHAQLRMAAGLVCRRVQGSHTRAAAPPSSTRSIPCSSSSPSGLTTMVDVITVAPGYLYSVLAKRERRLVRVMLPKFDTKFSWDLESWGSRCRSRRRWPTCAACTRKTATAAARLNEVGTEAATVTVALRGGPPPDIVEFVADHPFTFFIMEEQSGMIVFAGHVLDPSN
uniref:Serpin domain-containing protein n=1 Tax=Oryza punctata TaxID=4537 RepID=A0A0E0MGL1_ORYPU